MGSSKPDPIVTTTMAVGVVGAGVPVDPGACGSEGGALAGDPDSVQGRRWIERLSTDDLYWKPFLHYGAKVMRFDESSSSAAQVLSELEGRHAQPLLIQKEIVTKKIEQTTMWSIVSKRTPVSVGERALDSLQLNEDDLIIL